MGVQQSKEELLYHQVSYGNVQGIKALHREGAGLEWVDREGKTPLIVACLMPNGLPVVKTLIELGANVNAFRPGSHAGTPLHHAAKRGFEQTVNFLLCHGANPFRINDDCETALDLARAKGFCNVVRTIESHICLFSGWLRLKSHVPNILEAFIPQFLTKKIWAVVIPCEHRNPMTPLKFELAMYSELQAAQPYATIKLWKANIEGPNFNEPDTAILIYDKKTRYKLLSANEGDKQQLMHFYNACKGIHQQSDSVPLTPLATPTGPLLAIPARPPFAIIPTTAPPPASEDEELAMAINASIQSAIAEGVPFPNTKPTSNSNGFGSSEKAKHNGCIASEAGPSTSSQVHLNQNNNPVIVPSTYDISPSVAVPSAPPDTEKALANEHIHYPSIDSSPVSLAHPVMDDKVSASDDRMESIGASGSCVICLDAAVEGACIPCGHMAGCMSCLIEIKAKSWGCPVCRANIDQVVKLYAV